MHLYFGSKTCFDLLVNPQCSLVTLANMLGKLVTSSRTRPRAYSCFRLRSQRIWQSNNLLVTHHWFIQLVSNGHHSTKRDFDPRGFALSYLVRSSRLVLSWPVSFHPNRKSIKSPSQSPRAIPLRVDLSLFSFPFFSKFTHDIHSNSLSIILFVPILLPLGDLSFILVI